MSTSIDGQVFVWNMRTITSPPLTADGEPYKVVFVDGDTVETSTTFLAARFRTKHSRVLGAQFTARNLLLVAAELSFD